MTGRWSSAVLGSAATRGLFAGWWIVLALLPLGHITGLRNTLTVAVVILTLVLVRRDAWDALPARRTLLALVAWCALSIAWSTVPGVSFGKWKTDLVLPIAAYAAAFGYARSTRSMTALVAGAVTSVVVLALLSSTAFMPAAVVDAVRPLVDFEDFANVSHPLPWWYPGVGDASMAATLLAGVLVVSRAAARSIRAWWLAVAWLAILVVVSVANNRNALVALVVAIGFGLWCARRPPHDGGTRTRAGRGAMIAIVTLVVACIALGSLMESGARERLRALKVPVEGGSAFVTLTMRDTRPMIWRYYTRLALESPWIGVGFGRTVPGIHYATEADRRLESIESNAYIHAHNIALNWWLQTGIVGLALLVAALALVVRDVVRAGLSSSDGRRRAAAIGVVALVTLMVVRDATDDFLVYGIATMFWSLVGGFAGLALGPARASARPVSGHDGP